MNTHKLARKLLAAPEGTIICSVDLSTCEEDAGRRVFGDFIGINLLPHAKGFGSTEAVLVFEGSVGI